MKHHIKKSPEISLIILAIALLAACGTTKNFTIDSNPSGALVILQKHEPEWSLPEEPVGETPLNTSVTFFSDKSTASIKTEKRGYSSESLSVNKDSLEAVHFDLKKIEGVPEATFRKEFLSSAKYILLPAFVEVYIHSGVGRLDKTEYSQEVSKKVEDGLNSELERAVETEHKKIQRLALDESRTNDWKTLSENLNKYLLKLNAQRLAYYSLPPYLASNVEGIKPFLDQLPVSTPDGNTYLLYIYGKCVSETSGRKVGNVLLSLLGAAAMGVSQATGSGFQYIYDPTAFNPDSGTLAVIYVIDAKTSEVVHIEQRVFPDITDPDELKKMASVVCKFPYIDKKPD
jgi:hypothetical protein